MHVRAKNSAALGLMPEKVEVGNKNREKHPKGQKFSPF
jgi:hypothetical protein